MLNLKLMMNKLSKEEKKQLSYGFENGISIIIEHKGYFVGVNVIPAPKLEIIEQQGYWSFGKVK